MEHDSNDDPGDATAEWEQLLLDLTGGLAAMGLALRGLQSAVRRLAEMRPYVAPAAASPPEAAEAAAPPRPSAAHWASPGAEPYGRSTPSTRGPGWAPASAEAGPEAPRPSTDTPVEPFVHENVPEAPTEEVRELPDARVPDVRQAVEAAAEALPAVPGAGAATDAQVPADLDSVREEVRQAVARARAELEGGPAQRAPVLDWSTAEPRPWTPPTRDWTQPPPARDRPGEAGPKPGPLHEAEPPASPGETRPEPTAGAAGARVMPAAPEQPRDHEDEGSADREAQDVTDQVRRTVETASAEPAPGLAPDESQEAAAALRAHTQDQPVPLRDPAAPGPARSSQGEGPPVAPASAMAASWESLTQAHADDRYTAIIPTIVIEDPNGRVELVRVYDTLANLDCTTSATLATYMPHSVTVTIAQKSLPEMALIQQAVEAAFRRGCRITVDGNRATVRLSNYAKAA